MDVLFLLIIVSFLQTAASDIPNSNVSSRMFVEELSTEEFVSDSVPPKVSQESKEGISKGLIVYRQALLAKRMEQRKSILMLHDIQDLKKQAKLSKPAIETILKILDRHRSKVLPNVTDFDSLSVLEKEDISTILENILFLGDFILRLPDSTAKLLKKMNGAAETIQWAASFASSINLLGDVDLRVLNLMLQELNLSPRSEDYVNVYTESYKRQQLEAQKHAAKEAAKGKKTDKKEKHKSRPLMSGHHAGEL